MHLGVIITRAHITSCTKKILTRVNNYKLYKTKKTFKTFFYYSKTL